MRFRFPNLPAQEADALFIWPPTLVVIVHTHGNFIVLACWETRLTAPHPDFILYHIILILSQPVLALSYLYPIRPYINTTLGGVPKLIDCGSREWEIGSSAPSQFKPMTYKIDTCLFLAWNSALIG